MDMCVCLCSKAQIFKTKTNKKQQNPQTNKFSKVLGYKFNIKILLVLLHTKSKQTLAQLNAENIIYKNIKTYTKFKKKSNKTELKLSTEVKQVRNEKTF